MSCYSSYNLKVLQIWVLFSKEVFLFFQPYVVVEKDLVYTITKGLMCPVVSIITKH